MTETYTVSYADLSPAEADRQAIEDSREFFGETMFKELEATASGVNTAMAAKLFIALAPAIFGCRGRVLTALLRKHNMPIWRQLAAEEGVELTPDGFIVE